MMIIFCSNFWLFSFALLCFRWICLVGGLILVFWSKNLSLCWGNLAWWNWDGRMTIVVGSWSPGRCMLLRIPNHYRDENLNSMNFMFIIFPKINFLHVCCWIHRLYERVFCQCCFFFVQKQEWSINSLDQATLLYTKLLSVI